jgi:two-component system chemotaxis response regulator CheY
MAPVKTRSQSGGAAPVMIVEDDHDLRNAMAELLRADGYELVLAKNGLEALEALREHTPSLLLIDLLMPIMNGVELIGRLRSDPAWRDLPVVVMTAANDRIVGVDVESLKVPVLRKPVDLETLARVLADFRV